MKTVIYHSADYDGIFCREIARRFLPADTEFIGWNFGQPLIKVLPNQTVYVLDLSPDCLDPLTLGNPEMGSLIWIDHHKTAIDKWPASLAGFRIDGVAACRLAWQWFHGLTPDKPLFVNRSVVEPWSVRLAGEYDVWDKRDLDAEAFQYGLRSCEGEPPWTDIFTNNYVVEAMITGGRITQRYARNVDASIVRGRAFLLQWEGLTFICLNTARFNSLTFAAIDKLESGHDALMGYCFDGCCTTVSLYHAAHRTDLDLSAIAKKHGGGGHRGACGFTVPIERALPFDLMEAKRLPGNVQ